MTAAEDRFRVGDLKGCLTELQNEVRRRPADAKLRTFLAQVLILTGDWDRALNQLTVMGELDAGALHMKHAYTAAIQCERWIALLLQSLSVSAQGRSAQAAALRAQALEEAPVTAGTLNGEPFEWLADADSRLGPVLEVLLNGSYYWVPFARIRRIEFEKPADARDLVWIPAQFTWSNAGEAMGFVPVRYPGSELSADDAVRMSRKTEWQALGDEAFAGLGQRILATSATELGLLEVREVTLDSGG
jgi:type VI secretion system protein ImpE